MKKNNSAGGCVVILFIIGAICYFPMKCYHNLTFDPLKYTVATEMANLRFGPGKNFSVIRSLNKDDIVFQISDSSYAKQAVFIKEIDSFVIVSDPQWLQVVNSNDTGWIHKSTLHQEKWE
ncbi:MAG: hypothetical protein RL059_936 [Bacteroidota bacterium]